MKKDKLFVVIVLGIIMSLSLGILIRGKKEISIVENRSLADFPKFSIDSFFSSDFQEDTEDAFVDQVILGEKLKSKYNLLKNKSLNTVIDALNLIRDKEYEVGNESNIDKNDSNKGDKTKPHNSNFKLDIVPRGNNLFEIMESNHLIFNKADFDISKENFKSKGDNYNALIENYPEITYNCYYIEVDEDIDFINGSIDHKLIKTFHGFLDTNIKKSALYINQPSDFKKFFYKTDHHWNEKGQLEGYKQIIKLLKGEEEELLDIQTVSIDGAKYNGYKSRQIDNYSIYDDFKILVSDLPEHRVFINGEEKPYGKKQEYLKGNFEIEKGLNYYGEANGGDFGVVKYDFNNSNKENLLVFSDSFSNPIKEFIAAHYNNTYFIDFRDYEVAYGKEFNFEDFVEENEITQVLFSGYRSSYANDEFLVTD